MSDCTIFPPVRFGCVNGGIYRGGYPVLRNFKFLHKTCIKTILSLIPESPTNDLQMFGKVAGINIIHIPISRVVNLNSPSLLSSLLKALSVLINSANYPLYVHCLDGRRITSLLVLLTRRLQCWSCSYAIGEYWKYQICWKSSVGLLEIEKQAGEIEKVIYGGAHAPSNSTGGTDTDGAQSQNAFELTVPAEYAAWLWQGERGMPLPTIPGWRLVQETHAVTIMPSLTMPTGRERPVASSSPGLETSDGDGIQ